MGEWVNFWLSSVLVPGALMLGGLFFLWYLGGSPLRHPREMLRGMMHRHPGDSVSPFRALTLALAGTLGVGNIVGVASAIALGGPGAVFWMWVSALLAMVLKYGEIVLAVRHRVPNGTGGFRGGAMYYIREAFSHGRLPRVGGVLAAVFALLCIADALSMGCMIQVNAIAGSLSGVFRVPGWLCGVILTGLTALVVGKGAEKLSFLTEWLVPLMSGGYLILSLAVLVLRRDSILPALGSIFSGIWQGRGVAGGVMGYGFLQAVRFGTMRGLLSNEAGCGTAPIAHAASGTDSPAEQGFFGIFEVFADTILLCTMTALVILVSPEVLSLWDGDGAMLTIRAFGAVLGTPAGYFLAVAVLLFGFATVVCWSHYGMECVRYLTGRRVWRVVYSGAVLLAVLAGAVVAPQAVWLSSDLILGVMTLTNLLALFWLRREIREETRLYFRK